MSDFVPESEVHANWVGHKWACATLKGAGSDARKHVGNRTRIRGSETRLPEGARRARHRHAHW
eukprot:8202044-Alexandrium_andersonii.AAC.1